MGRHLFFFLLAKSKVVREVRDLGQNRPMVQYGAIRHNTDPVVRGILACSRQREDKGREKVRRGREEVPSLSSLPRPLAFFLLPSFCALSTI